MDAMLRLYRVWTPADPHIDMGMLANLHSLNHVVRSVCVCVCLLQEGMDSPEAMQDALRFVVRWGSLLAFILIPVWPLLALPAGVFSKGMHSSSLKPLPLPSTFEPLSFLLPVILSVTGVHVVFSKGTHSSSLKPLLSTLEPLSRASNNSACLLA